jgi:DNA-binding MarR family transcriptional regulator
MKRNGPKVHTIEGEAQRRAISSPVRMEILGYFSAGRPLSVREVAERMGRPASAIHYHVRLLAQSGLLKKSGERRDGRRREAEYSMIADAIAVPGHGQPSEDGDNLLAVKTMAGAFRMAERDMKSALTEGAARGEGEDRNFYVTRVHLRLSREEMAEINRRLDELLGAVLDSIRREEPRDDDEFVSLTLALVPLPDRSTGSS